MKSLGLFKVVLNHHLLNHEVVYSICCTYKSVVNESENRILSSNESCRKHQCSYGNFISSNRRMDITFRNLAIGFITVNIIYPNSPQKQ